MFLNSENWQKVKATVRACVGLTLVCVILGAPFYRQVLSGKERWIPRWTMFSGKALGFLSLRYEAVDASGKRHVLPWGRVYPVKKNQQRPIRAKRITSLELAQGLGRNLCPELGEETQVYLFARRAVSSGWKKEGHSKNDLCEPSSSPAPKPSTRKSKAR